MYRQNYATSLAPEHSVVKQSQYAVVPYRHHKVWLCSGLQRSRQMLTCPQHLWPACRWKSLLFVQCGNRSANHELQLVADSKLACTLDTQYHGAEVSDNLPSTRYRMYEGNRASVAHGMYPSILDISIIHPVYGQVSVVVTQPSLICHNTDNTKANTIVHECGH